MEHSMNLNPESPFSASNLYLHLHRVYGVTWSFWEESKRRACWNGRLSICGRPQVPSTTSITYVATILARAAGFHSSTILDPPPNVQGFQSCQPPRSLVMPTKTPNEYELRLVKVPAPNWVLLIQAIDPHQSLRIEGPGLLIKE